jgi:hypothetical protein
VPQHSIDNNNLHGNSILQVPQHSIDNNNLLKPYRCCNCYCAPLERSRSWVGVQFGVTKDYKIGLCCFSTKHTALRSKRRGVSRIYYNVSWWLIFHRLLLQWVSTIKIKQILSICENKKPRDSNPRCLSLVASSLIIATTIGLGI